MNIYRAMVEDNIDPEHLGRVRIRVMGVHSPKLKDVKTEQLPWSECIQPLNQGNTLGQQTFMKIGAWCFCTPLNDSFSEFLVLGSAKGLYNKTQVSDADGEAIGFRDPLSRFPTRPQVPDNPLTYGLKNEKNPVRERVEVETFKEDIDTSPNAIYPDNEVFEDHNGNIIEIDGSRDNSRIRIQHSSGARVEISVDGDITLQASVGGNIWMETPGLFAIGADGNLIIDNDVKITGSLEVVKDLTGDANITSKGETTDMKGNLSSLRDTYDKHQHLYLPGSGGPTPSATPSTPDPLIRVKDFTWSGTPK